VGREEQERALNLGVRYREKDAQTVLGGQELKHLLVVGEGALRSRMGILLPFIISDTSLLRYLQAFEGSFSE
jgi:hypothetical protein